MDRLLGVFVVAALAMGFWTAGPAAATDRTRGQTFDLVDVVDLEDREAAPPWFAVAPGACAP